MSNTTKPTRWIHPQMQQSEVWPGPQGGYPWANTPNARLWTREALLRRTGPNELLCTWTTGGYTEPGPGNFTMIARSEDNGATWKDYGRFQHGFRGLFTTELFSPREGEVHAFLNTYDTGQWMTQLLSYRSISTDGGATWSAPNSIPGGVQGVWPNKGIVHSNGRWIIPVSWAEHIGEEWAEPSDGRAPMVTMAGTRVLPQTELPHSGELMAKYLAGVEWADKNHRYATGVIISDDNGKTFRLRGYLTGGKHGLLMEPRVVELGNGDVVMLIRSQRDGWLWESRSTDGGETWSKAVQSNIPNPAAKILLLRGEDNRIYLVHNPTGHDGATMGGRNPLSLWISDDDMKTWSVKVDLVRDDAPYVSLNYPDGFIDEKERILQFVWEDTVTVYHAKVSLDIKA